MTQQSTPGSARPRRAAVIQLEAVHEEVVNSVFEALLANGIEPTAFLNERILARSDLFKAFTPHAHRVNYRRVDNAADWAALAEEVKEFDLLFFNTFQREGQAKWARSIGLPAMGIIHNPKLFLEQPTCRDMVKTGELVPMTLAPHVTSWLMAQQPHLFAHTGTLSTWMWDMPEPTDRATRSRRRITIPGAVDFRNRDYLLILDQLPGLVATYGRDHFEIAVAGGGRDRDELQRLVAEKGLGDVFTFAPLDPGTGFVPSEIFFPEVAGSDFLLPLLPETRQDYRGWKITLAVSSSMGFNVPAIIDRWTATVYGLPAVTYPLGELPRGLAQALEMSDDDIASLRSSLATFRASEIDRAVKEMAFGLEVLDSGRKPVAAAPARATGTGTGTGTMPRPSGRDDLAAFLQFAQLALPHSFSQRLQDLWAIWEGGFRRTGYFVEFGALNGKDFSNSYVLERLGWNGVVAEPHPDYARHVRRNRTCTVSTKCVFDKTGDSVTFHAVRGRPALSTVQGFGDNDIRSDLRKEYVSYEVETISLNDLLDESQAPPVIDYLSIDTEGSEPVILRAFDFAKRPVRLMTVEHNDHQREELLELLGSHGFHRKWPEISGHDDWYVHESALGEWSSEGMQDAIAALSGMERFERMLDERTALVQSLRAGLEKG